MALDFSATIRNKLIMTVILTAILSVGLVSLGLIVNEYYSTKTIAEKQLVSIADIIATNSTNALAFNDKATIRDLLNSLSKQPGLVRGELYDSKDRQVVAFNSENAGIET
ncbi:MAG: hypothetical protein IPN42_13525 [Methylococcaceae bacterium]|nr:hypothetical protein [Methylococcaceae bacterium]